MAPPPILLLYGNCQSGVLEHALRVLLADRAEIHAVLAFDIEQGRPERFLDVIDLSRVAVSLEQKESLGPTPAWLTERLPADAVRLHFTALDTNLLWPFRFNDPRNIPEPGFPWGRYPYGDRLVVELMRAGLTGQALLEAYMDQSPARLPDLDRLAAIEQTRLEARDAGTAVAMADIVMGELRRRQLFHTCNHPTGWLLVQLAARLLDAIRPVLHHTANLDALSGFDPLYREQVPIHPVVARRLKLAWWQPGQTYNRTNGAPLNFRQYMRRYIAWE